MSWPFLSFVLLVLEGLNLLGPSSFEDEVLWLVCGLCCRVGGILKCGLDKEMGLLLTDGANTGDEPS